MEKETKIVIGIILGALLIAGSIYFRPEPQEKVVILDIKDREKGICADMYADGYDWGLGQIPLQVSIWRLEGKSEASVKELLYDMLKDWSSNK